VAVRIKEQDLILPSLRIAASKPGGIISTSDLILELEALFQPDGLDAEVLDGRNDTRFSQKVRNLVSHREANTSMFSKGYANYTGDGLQITEAGELFLSHVPE
jgi:hypothetical protein